MSDGAFQFGGYQHDEFGFDLEATIARVNERRLRDPDYWKRVGLPMPVRYLQDSIAIPESIRKDVERDEEPRDQFGENDER